MKRTIIILITVLTLSVAGVLFGNNLQSDEREAVSWEEGYMAQYPSQLPDFILDPMVGYPVF